MIPCLSSAGDAVTGAKPAPTMASGHGTMNSLTNTVCPTNGLSATFTLEYSFNDTAAYGTNSHKSIPITRVRPEKPESEFGEFVMRHMTPDQEYRFVSCDVDSSRLRRTLASVSAGFGEFFYGDTSSATYQGSNGARREAPGYLYVRSRFEF